MATTNRGALLLDAHTLFFDGEEGVTAADFTRAEASIARLAEGAAGRAIIAYIATKRVGRLAGALLADMFWEAGAHAYAVPDPAASLAAAVAADPGASVLTKAAAAAAAAGVPEDALYHTWTFGRSALRLVRTDARLARLNGVAVAEKAAAAPPPDELPPWGDVRAPHAARALGTAKTPFEHAVVDGVATGKDLLSAARDAAEALKADDAVRTPPPRAPRRGASANANGDSGVRGRERRPPFTVCRECGCAFVVTSNEREWFAAKQLEPPARCRPCRAARRKEGDRN